MSGPYPAYRWHVLLPAGRYVFAIEDGRLVEFDERGEEPAERFRRYQELKSSYPVHGMIAWPNTILLQGPRTIVIDPGLVTQGPPLLLALARLGLQAADVELVVNTHGHMDHTQANAFFPAATQVIHSRERLGGSPEGGVPLASLRLLEGSKGEIEPGLDFLLTPGHTEGSICLLVKVAEGRLVVAGDTVGPLPEYFSRMELPEGYPGAEALLESWRLVRELRPDVLIPGHNPPMTSGAW